METIQKNVVALSEVPPTDGADIFSKFLLNGETVDFCFKGIRDRAVITNKRIIIIDVQGITGKKKELLFIPYSKIVAYAVESAGTIDLTSELKIWMSGIGGIKLNFTAKTDIFRIGQHLGQFII